MALIKVVYDNNVAIGLVDDVMNQTRSVIMEDLKVLKCKILKNEVHKKLPILTFDLENNVKMYNYPTEK